MSAKNLIDIFFTCFGRLAASPSTSPTSAVQKFRGTELRSVKTWESEIKKFLTDCERFELLLVYAFFANEPEEEFLGTRISDEILSTRLDTVDFAPTVEVYTWASLLRHLYEKNEYHLIVETPREAWGYAYSVEENRLLRKRFGLHWCDYPVKFFYWLSPKMTVPDFDELTEHIAQFNVTNFQTSGKYGIINSVFNRCNDFPATVESAIRYAPDFGETRILLGTLVDFLERELGAEQTVSLRILAGRRGFPVGGEAGNYAA